MSIKRLHSIPMAVSWSQSRFVSQSNSSVFYMDYKYLGFRSDSWTLGWAFSWMKLNFMP